MLTFSVVNYITQHIKGVPMTKSFGKLLLCICILAAPLSVSAFDLTIGTETIAYSGYSDIYGYKYHPGIIRNAEFEEGLKGWTTHEAEPGAIQTEHMDDLALIKGRYHAGQLGRTFLLTRRCAKSPNKVSQVIKNLTPGRLYSARMFASDYQNTLDGKETETETGARLIIEQAEMIKDKSFVSEFKGSRKRRFDLHRQVFRATSTTAKLTISDWTDETTPGGPIGQKIICNFIQVQPYFD